MSSTQSDNLFMLVREVEWPTPQHTIDFMEAAETLWGTDAGREEVRRWAAVLGKPSQFMEGTLWTVQQIKDHFLAWDEWEKHERAQREPQKGKVGRPRSFDMEERCKQAERKAAWHDAVRQRKETLLISKEKMDAIIADARAAHRKLIAEWDAYCDHMRKQAQSGN